LSVLINKRSINQTVFLPKPGTKIEKSEYISPELLRSGKTDLKLSGCRVQQLVEIKIIPVKTSELIAFSLPSGVYRILMRLTK